MLNLITSRSMTDHRRTPDRSHDFDALTPEIIFGVVESAGFVPSGSLNALNSYENRVYEIPLDNAPALIAKFYRPRRWSPKQIDEEHRLTLHIQRSGVAVVAPLALKRAVSGCAALGRAGTYHYVLFPRACARMESEITDARRSALGSAIGKMHAACAAFTACHRIEINPKTYGWDSLAGILDKTYAPEDMNDHLEAALTDALDTAGQYYRQGLRLQLVHGDLHPGNILWDAKGPVFVDFDDSAFAPVVQDLWMLCSGNSLEVKSQQKILTESYRGFAPFDQAEFALVEALRTLRVIRHAAWIGERYGEPAFTRAFPYYTERRYWEATPRACCSCRSAPSTRRGRACV
ncbi:MAG: serine/threonine protein kinase [Armatimonadetes bacterium]|nr:serine/threonine protein kinase [Armatimonadota bacterium]